TSKRTPRSAGQSPPDRQRETEAFTECDGLLGVCKSKRRQESQCVRAVIVEVAKGRSLERYLRSIPNWSGGLGGYSAHGRQTPHAQPRDDRGLPIGSGLHIRFQQPDSERPGFWQYSEMDDLFAMDGFKEARVMADRLIEADVREA